MHARTLTAQLNRIMLIALASCGGTIDTGDSGIADASNPIDTGLPGCNAEWIDAGSVCGAKEAQLSGSCDVKGDAGQVPLATCKAICGPTQTFCQFNTTTNILTCGGLCIGRLPACLQGESFTNDATSSAVGEYLARAAYLEAAAVFAFGILAKELAAHGAPPSLKRAAQRAAADEVRHARAVGTLAEQYGATVNAPSVTHGEVRPLVDIAIENAIEGCVRETFGALVASWQAEHARDASVKNAMKRIARDEARHAALGWRLFDWTNETLSMEDRARVNQAMARAVSELEAATRVEPNHDIATVLGLPSAAHASALVRGMRREKLWS